MLLQTRCVQGSAIDVFGRDAYRSPSNRRQPNSQPSDIKVQFSRQYYNLALGQLSSVVLRRQHKYRAVKFLNDQNLTTPCPHPLSQFKIFSTGFGTFILTINRVPYFCLLLFLPVRHYSTGTAICRTHLFLCPVWNFLASPNNISLTVKPILPDLLLPKNAIFHRAVADTVPLTTRKAVLCPLSRADVSSQI